MEDDQALIGGGVGGAQQSDGAGGLYECDGGACGKSDEEVVSETDCISEAE